MIFPSLLTPFTCPELGPHLTTTTTRDPHATDKFFGFFRALFKGADGGVARSGCRSAVKAHSEIIPVYTHFPEIPISITFPLVLM